MKSIYQIILLAGFCIILLAGGLIVGAAGVDTDQEEEGPRPRPIVQPDVSGVEGIVATVAPSFNRLSVGLDLQGSLAGDFSVLSGKYFLDFLEPGMEVRVPIIVENTGEQEIVVDLSFRRPDSLLQGSNMPSRGLLNDLLFLGDYVEGNVLTLAPDTLSVVNVAYVVPEDVRFDKQEVWASFRIFEEDLACVEYCCRIIFTTKEVSNENEWSRG